ncbi:hypothetical protein J7384_03975 [Endozoicomonas sp. G2_1]|uniref:hypothetical protein n=1 Tax=Endozoicomonas sp. G2_1 TaxID=2821091 RepID=UPI001ADAD25A|nr:hypothetical protein [Endozoicomonas sp. G2_1]MBO9489514.1 hypothetical protein [Endozoicomonas sp. G2_1]
MSWDDFHFNCRVLSCKLSDGMLLSEAQQYLIDNYQEYRQVNLVGEQQKLLEKILAENDSVKVHQLLVTYGSLNFSLQHRLSSKLMKIKRYLLFLFAVFILTSTIFKVYVLPVFVDFFAKFDSDVVYNLQAFEQSWLISTVLLVTVTVLLLYFIFLAKRLGQQLTSNALSKVAKLALSKKVIKELCTIQDLMNAPIQASLGTEHAKSAKFIQQLSKDKIDVGFELQALLDKHKERLSMLINKRMGRILVFLSLVVFYAIYLFVSSLYAPIFAMGAVV